MPSSHLIVRQSRLGAVYYWGLVTGEEILEEARKLLGHPDLGPGFSLLWDASSMESLDLTLTQMHELTELIRAFWKRAGGGRSAVVVTLPDAVASVELFKALSPAEIARDIQLFDDPISALRWLAAESVRFRTTDTVEKQVEHSKRD